MLPDAAAFPRGWVCLQIVKDRNVRGPGGAAPDEPGWHVAAPPPVARPLLLLPQNKPEDGAKVQGLPERKASPDLKKEILEWLISDSGTTYSVR